MAISWGGSRFKKMPDKRIDVYLNSRRFFCDCFVIIK